MAQTRFSGPVASDNGFIGDVTGDVTGNIDGEVTASVLVLPTSDAATVGNIDDTINTAGKVAGKAVVDLSDGLIYVATGTAANADWVASDGTTSITPA
jgi:hypothetical protein